jgi:gluconate 2-dehydrogenase gamma chain
MPSTGFPIRDEPYRQIAARKFHPTVGACNLAAILAASDIVYSAYDNQRRRRVGKVTRRTFVTTVGAATVAPVYALLAANTTSPSRLALPKPASAADVGKPAYLFFNAAEASFIEAACERLIPTDESGPGALGAGAPNYLDKQLGGAWGAGERLYRSGPWQAGTPWQGYQLPFTPAELFHSALRAINDDFTKHGSPFSELSPQAQDAYLKSLEAGGKDLDGVPSAIFFALLLQMTVEGFFSDPVYGGNRDMVAWRMSGFPGAYADYSEAIDRHGVKFEREPTLRPAWPDSRRSI